MIRDANQRDGLLGDDWLTPPEVADILNISVKTLHRWTREGVGPPFLQYTKQTRRYSRSGLVEWIDKRYTPGSEARAS